MTDEAPSGSIPLLEEDLSVTTRNVQALLDHQHFLDDGNHESVPVFPWFWYAADFPAGFHALDFNRFADKFSAGKLHPFVSHSSDANPSCLDIASSYRKVLFEKRYASRRCFVGHAGSPVQAGVPRKQQPPRRVPMQISKALKRAVLEPVWSGP
jgi:hypothetical protein